MNKILLNTLISGILGSVALQGATLVDLTGENLNTANDGSTLNLIWGGASDADNNYGGDGGITDRSRSRTFTSPTTNYAGPAFSGRSIATTFDSGSVSFDNQSNGIGIRDLNPSADSFNIRAGNGSSPAAGALTIWQIGFAQANWADLTTGNVGFDNTSSFSIAGINGSHSEAWLMVVADGTSYVATTSGSIADLSAANFNSYDNRNATNALWNSGTGTTVTGSAIDNITEVGLYIEIDVAAGTSPNGASNFAQFDISAVAVPEPSSYALISGFLALGWIMARRRS